MNKTTQTLDLNNETDMLNRFRTTMATLGGLRLRDVWWMIQILFMIALIPILHRLLALPMLVKLFDVQPRRPASSSKPRERLHLLMQGLLRRTLRRNFCLSRSLILFHFCRKWGYPTQIHFGMMKRKNDALGHAWISVAGEPFAEATNPEDLYTPFFVYPEQV